MANAPGLGRRSSEHSGGDITAPNPVQPRSLTSRERKDADAAGASGIEAGRRQFNSKDADVAGVSRSEAGRQQFYITIENNFQ